MKFSKLSQLALVSILGLGVATLLSGCMLVTIDYLYVADSTGSGPGSAGQIQSFAVDAETGALRLTDNKPVPSGGSQPIALAASAGYQDLYVANAGNKTVVHFTIAYSGALTQKETTTLPFTPSGLAVNTAQTALYVVGGTSPGQLAVYPLSSGAVGTLASTITLTLPGFSSDIIVPTAVAVLPNNSSVYVAAYDQSAYNPGGAVTSSANPGWLYAYNVGSNGALTPVTNSPFQAGVKPSALSTAPTNRFVYATDFASNQVIGYGVLSSGELSFLVNGPFKTGNEPASVVVDPRGMYLYVANSLQNTVSAYTIAQPSGTPSAVINVSGSSVNATDTTPVSILVDPGLGRFVYTANNLGNSISGFQLDPNTGVLKPTILTPYPTGLNPTALAAVPHGNHPVQEVTP
ncbi:MAG: lactonase family protein [Acidobacteriota bacterium]